MMDTLSKLTEMRDFVDIGKDVGVKFVLDNTINKGGKKGLVLQWNELLETMAVSTVYYRFGDKFVEFFFPIKTVVGDYFQFVIAIIAKTLMHYGLRSSIKFMGKRSILQKVFGSRTVNMKSIIMEVLTQEISGLVLDYAWMNLGSSPNGAVLVV